LVGSHTLHHQLLVLLGPALGTHRTVRKSPNDD
jgi:hypothetical protein